MNEYEKDTIVGGCLVVAGTLVGTIVFYGAAVAGVLWVAVHVLRALGVLH